MQLVWSDILKKEPDILEMTKTYMDTMGSMNTGKASTKFREKAAELGNKILVPILVPVLVPILVLILVSILVTSFFPFGAPFWSTL